MTLESHYIMIHYIALHDCILPHMRKVSNDYNINECLARSM